MEEMKNYKFRIEVDVKVYKGNPEYLIHYEDQRQAVKGHEYSPPRVNSIPHLLSELSDSI